jgi:hypothetical protein
MSKYTDLCNDLLEMGDKVRAFTHSDEWDTLPTRVQITIIRTASMLESIEHDLWRTTTRVADAPSFVPRNNRGWKTRQAQAEDRRNARVPQRGSQA